MELVEKTLNKIVLEKAFATMATAKAMTELYEENFKIVSKYVHATSRGHEAIQIALAIQGESGPKLKDFIDLIATNNDVKALAKRVHAFATQFPMPGFDPKTMKYTNPDGPHA